MADKPKIKRDELDMLKRVIVSNLIKKVKKGHVLTGPQWDRVMQFAEVPDSPVDSMSAAGSIVVLCKCLEITRKAFYQYRKRPGAPLQASNGNYDVTAWRLFLQKQGVLRADDDEDVSEQKRQLEVDKLRIQCGILTIEYKRAQSLVVEKEIVIAWIHEQIQALKKRFLGLPNSLAPRLHNKKPAEIAKILKKTIRNILENLADYEMGK